MRLVVFGLAVSSSWGNGYATLWRGLAAALARGGHRLPFLERDQPLPSLLGEAVHVRAATGVGEG